MRFFIIVPGDDSPAHQLYAPEGEHDESGLDLRFPHEVRVEPGQLVKVDLGVIVKLVGDSEDGGLVPCPFFVCLRSSACKAWRTVLMPNAPGVIDANYCGNLMILLYNPGSDVAVFKAHEAVAQAVAPSLASVRFTRIAFGSPECVELLRRDRGGGFGSTGVAGKGAA